MGSFAAAGSLNGGSRLILMSAVIEQAEAKRRCLAVGSCLRSPRYGLHGVCSGDASNPGSSQSRQTTIQ